ncbi:UNKNOWN [Stylonychia lemnae]|uniref:Uncharacterized protein n=1 Tax=Stylonychia lemnae TaxID=5949 RepID=A0A077ZP21_STYLE|nr:UNKNOWN [Stylonychia lemnae]|eukprot:CDW71130.1 UNKNOWN [Stylonychia lemnae]
MDPRVRKDVYLFKANIESQRRPSSRTFGYYTERQQEYSSTNTFRKNIQQFSNFSIERYSSNSKKPQASKDNTQFQSEDRIHISTFYSDAQTFQPLSGQSSFRENSLGQLNVQRDKQNHEETLQFNQSTIIQDDRFNVKYQDMNCFILILLFVKGDYFPEKGQLLIKFNSLVKTIVDSQILNRSQIKGFEIKLRQKYGNVKHSFNNEEIEQVLVFIAQHFFQKEIIRSPSAVLQLMFKDYLIPYIKNLVQANNQKALERIILDNNFRLKITSNNSIHQTLQKSAKIIHKLLGYYEDKNQHKKNFRASLQNYFNQCIIILMRDIEIVPFIIPNKDAFALFSIIAKQSEKGQVIFGTDQLLTYFQLISHYYIIIDSTEGLIDILEEQIKILLKRIEASKGYEDYRKEQIIESKDRPSILLINTITQASQQSSLQPSKHHASDRKPNKNLKTDSKVQSSRKTYSLQSSEEILEIIFNHFANPSKNLVKISFVHEILNLLEDLNQSDETDITSIKAISQIFKNGDNYYLSRQQFDQIFIELYDNFFSVLYDGVDFFIVKFLHPLAQQIINGTIQKPMNQTIDNGYNNQQPSLKHDLSIDIETRNMIQKLIDLIQPYFKMYSEKQLGQNLTLNGFTNFCKAFSLYPDLVQRSHIHQMYQDLQYQNCSTSSQSNGLFGIIQLCEAIAVIAFNNYNDQLDLRQISHQQALLYVIERMHNQQMRIDKQASQQMKNQIYFSNERRKDFLQAFNKEFKRHFPAQKNLQNKGSDLERELTLRDLINIQNFQ